MINTRNTYQTENLSESDFRLGLGYDTTLMNRLRYIKSKGNSKKICDSYWLESGYSIDGSIRIKRFHPLLGKTIVNKETNKSYVIDSVHKHWYMGNYWVLTAVDSKNSHTSLFYQNINCIDNTVIDGIKKTKENYYFVDQNCNFDIEFGV